MKQIKRRSSLFTHACVGFWLSYTFSIIIYEFCNFYANIYGIFKQSSRTLEKSDMQFDFLKMKKNIEPLFFCNRYEMVENGVSQIEVISIEMRNFRVWFKNNILRQ